MINKKLNIEPTLELQIKVLEGLTGKAGVTPRQSLSDEKSVLSYLLAKTRKNFMDFLESRDAGPYFIN